MYPTNPSLFPRNILLALSLLVLLQPLCAQTPTPTLTPTLTPTPQPAPTPTPAPTAGPAPAATNTATPTPPEIRLVSPKVTYPKKGEKHYMLSVIGNNLGKKANTKNMLLYVDDTIVQPLDWIEAKGRRDADKAYGIVQRDDTQLDFWLPWPKQSGVFKLKVGVDDRVSEASPEIIVSKIESKWKAAWLAALATLGLLGLPLYLVSRGGDTHMVGDKKYGALAAFFLDNETDTYSLSKFQFYVWTAVAIFGYVYLGLVESLVQGKAVFPEIPENLPAIILISAATGALATGITSAKGPKGSGEVHPSLGDFITAGGLVVAERFQFFIWTLLGAVTFLFFTLSSDPATLRDLPKIPDSFLQIMGISSLGYLSGKLARKPGAVIDDIQPVLPTPPVAPAALASPASPPTAVLDLTLIISGQKLSLDASLRIEETEVPVVTEVPKRDTAKPNDRVASTAQLRKDGVKEEQGDFYKQLTFDIYDADPKWKEPGKHKVTITNNDGKTASWTYEIKPKPAA